jgi:hypothetical protein
LPPPSRVKNLALFACLGVLVIAALSARLTKRLNFTGDEPRYLLQALSIALHGVPVMPESRYEEYRAAHRSQPSPVTYPFRELQPTTNEIEARTPRHPILTSLIYAPITPTCSLEIIRLLPFCIGLTGLGFLAITLVRQTRSVLSAIACFIPAGFCFPALPYLFLALPEIILFALTAITFWNLCSASPDKLSNFAPAIVCGCAAPFIHLRGLALFGAIAMYLIYLFSRGPDRRPLFLAGSIFIAALLALFAANLFLSRWLGTVGTIPIWKPRVLLNMFVHYRHGLLPYAPIWILSFAGLIAALYSRKSWAWPAGIFLLLFLLGSSLEIGEAYPARFWVQTVPVLALCLSGFTEGTMRSVVKGIVYLPLVALSLTNSAILIFDPGLHLSARSGTAPYDFLFKLVPSFHFGFWLDVPDSSHVRMAAICFCALVAGTIAAAAIRRSKMLEAIVCVLLLVGLEAHRVRPIAVTAAAESNAVVLRIPDTENVSGRPLRLRFQAPWKQIGPRPDESNRPFFEVVDGSTHWKMPIMSGSLLVHKSGAAVHEFSVTLRWIDRDPLTVDPGGPDKDVNALACNSVLAGLW